MYVFLDVPSVVTPTLNGLLDRVYGAENVFLGSRYRSLCEVAEAFDELPSPRKGEISVISQPFGVGLNRVLGSDNRYLLLFSDPAERVLAIHRAAKSGRRHMSLRKFVESGSVPEVDNGLVRLVSGSQTRPFGCIGTEDLEAAKANLRDRFATFGFADDFNASLVLFGEKLGWKHVPLYRVKSMEATRSAGRISARDRAIVEAHCRLDIELYRYARELYDEEIARLGQDFARELRTYEGALGDVERIIGREHADWKRKNSVIAKVTRKPARLLGHVRKALGLRTRLMALRRIFARTVEAPEAMPSPGALNGRIPVQVPNK